MARPMRFIRTGSPKGRHRGQTDANGFPDQTRGHLAPWRRGRTVFLEQLVGFRGPRNRLTANPVARRDRAHRRLPPDRIDRRERVNDRTGGKPGSPTPLWRSSIPPSSDNPVTCFERAGDGASGHSRRKASDLESAASQHSISQPRAGDPAIGRPAHGPSPPLGTTPRSSAPRARASSGGAPPPRGAASTRAIGTSTDERPHRVDTLSVIISISDKDCQEPLAGFFGELSSPKRHPRKRV
jgi:hypothetical protein